MRPRTDRHRADSTAPRERASRAASIWDIISERCCSSWRSTAALTAWSKLSIGLEATCSPACSVCGFVVDCGHVLSTRRRRHDKQLAREDRVRKGPLEPSQHHADGAARRLWVYKDSQQSNKLSPCSVRYLRYSVTHHYTCTRVRARSRAQGCHLW